MKRWLTFRRKVILIVVGLFIGGGSIFFTNGMARRVRDRERQEVRLWTRFLVDENMSHPSEGDVPFLIVDGGARVRYAHLVEVEVLSDPERLRRTMMRMGMRNPVFEMMSPLGEQLWVYYGRSALQRAFILFPFAQIVLLIIFVAFGYITFRTSRDDEQNRVWIGLAKETAHQLGTPTSSLLGWLEYLRSQPIDQTVVDEIGNDLTRLTKVVDRFSKIGSETELSEANVNEVVGECVDYFRGRIPKGVSISYNGLAMAPVSAMINNALFEWVIENLLKNALDALQGRGEIDVGIWCDDTWANIDVRDTGKGIARSNWKRIFEPGYTTKTRGWGLGLSLSKRIIEEYHRGRIYVANSEPGTGTTMRVQLQIASLLPTQMEQIRIRG